jgi:dTDP-4-amino-4,6-dideoxygalactose transaminase
MTVAANTIPLVDLATQHRQIAAEVEDRLRRVMESGAFVDGPDVRAFEQEFAELCGVAHCVGVANGTDAIELALRAGGIQPGDKVAIPANTFVATAEAVVRAGATPVLLDVDPRHLLMDPARLSEALTDPAVRGVIPVHLYGQMAPMEEITRAARSQGCLLVEDAAQCQGATQLGDGPGVWGDLAATSFYPGKNLGAYGDAGAVVTSSPDLARHVRLLGNHGSEVRYRHEVVGWNSRLDTLQAVVLRAKLSRLAAWNAERRVAAARYTERLRSVETVGLPTAVAGNEHVWHLYVVRIPQRDGIPQRDQILQRDKVLERLHSAGIGAGVHYPVPVHLQPAFRSLGHREGAFPVAERAAHEILSLPLFPGITEAQQDQVVDELLRALDQR